MKNPLPNTKLTAALAYYNLGWSVIPLLGKVPTTAWANAPRLSPETLALLYEDPLPFNLGVILGKVSNLVAIDLDGAAGLAEFTRLCDLCHLPIAELHQTWSFTTPNGGLRLLYHYDSAIATWSHRSDGHELIRFMSDGTQTVAPPSSLDKRYYTWLVPPNQTDISLKKCPTDAILHLMASLPPKQSPVSHPAEEIKKSDAYYRARKYLAACDPAISGQGGHNQLFKIAVRVLKGFQLSYHQSLYLILSDYNPRCCPPWSEKEIEHKLEDALKITSPYRNML